MVLQWEGPLLLEFKLQVNSEEPENYLSCLEDIKIYHKKCMWSVCLNVSCMCLTKISTNICSRLRWKGNMGKKSQNINSVVNGPPKSWYSKRNNNLKLNLVRNNIKTQKVRKFFTQLCARGFWKLFLIYKEVATIKNWSKNICKSSNQQKLAYLHMKNGLDLRLEFLVCYDYFLVPKLENPNIDVNVVIKLENDEFLKWIHLYTKKWSSSRKISIQTQQTMWSTSNYKNSRCNKYQRTPNFFGPEF